MKKVKLAHLDKKDFEWLQAQERYCGTYKSLLKNRYFDDEAKEKLFHEYQIELAKLYEAYDTIIRKYELPEVLNKGFYLSAVDNSIIVEIPD